MWLPPPPTSPKQGANAQQETERAHLSAPTQNPLPKSNRRATFPRNVRLSREALKWHYNMCVIESMCALFLDAGGGVKHLPWREGPVLINCLGGALNWEVTVRKEKERVGSCRSGH